MRFLTRFSLRNPVAIIILGLLVVVGGIVSAFSLKEELMPDISIPTITVVTSYPGATPSEVANDVTSPLERALNGTQDVQLVTSNSVANTSEIELQLNINANLDKVQDAVEQTVDKVQLPSTAGKPSVESFSLSNAPVLEFTVASTKIPMQKLQDLVNNTVIPAMQGVSGVASVSASGANANDVIVTFDAAKLDKYHLTLQQVEQTLQSDNVTMPLGTATVGNQVQPVQLNGQYQSIADIENLPLAVQTAPAATASAQAMGGTSAQTTAVPTTIPLKDVATVTEQSPISSINRTNGQPSIMLSVYEANGANTVAVVKAAKAELTALHKELPSGVSTTTVYDSSQMITSSINGLLHEALLGALFAVIVILLFLRNWLTTLIAVVSIPVSILSSIMLLSRFGVTLNIMTLGGLAIATGRVVDDSIVVIENIYRAWKSGLGYGRKLVMYATAEVGKAILSSSLATIAVFLPLALVSGVVGKIFEPFALTVVFSLISSLIVALTIVPLFAWLFVVRKPPKGKVAAWLNGATVDRAEGVIHPSLIDQTYSDETGTTAQRPKWRPWQVVYRKALSWCLNHKVWVVLGTAVAFVASIAVLPIVGSTFMPNSTAQEATVSITLPVGTPLDVTNQKAQQVENIIRKDTAEIETINTQVGGQSGTLGGTGTSQTNTATLDIALKPSADVNQFISKVQSQMQALNRGNTKIQVQGVSSGGGQTAFDIVVTGPNDSAIQSAATQITNRLAKVQGLTNVSNNLSQKQPEIRIAPDKERMAKYGLTAQAVANTISAYVSEQNIGSVTLNGQAHDLDVALKPAGSLNSLTAIRDLTVMATPAGQVNLGDVATVERVQTPTSVLHENGHSYAEITADYTSNKTNQVEKTAMQAIQSLHLPHGVQVQQSISNQQNSQDMASLVEAIGAAVVIVYIVMLITFGEWSAPFAILFSMPVALIGAFFGSLVTKQPISISSMIGILMLMGIVVTNAIVLVGRVEQQRSRGLTIREALLEAGTTRLRPILMTAIATICALLPLAFGSSEGLLLSQGLAVVVIGGIVTSTILTLCIVPLMYELLHYRIARRERRRMAHTHTH